MISKIFYFLINVINAHGKNSNIRRIKMKITSLWALCQRHHLDQLAIVLSDLSSGP